ncbi:ester cyclase [bacterium]|nr:ester cyclase [bacterium]MBU1435574.1 ester cyclase [bacterium]MBU1502502.1 ester cyclase [bacterium]
MKTNKQIVTSYYENLWNKQDKSYVDKLLHDDIVFRGSLNIETRGKKEFLDYFDTIIKGIPNLYHSVEIMVSEGSFVTTRTLYNGTHSGELAGFKPTGNHIVYYGASFFKMKDEKIIDIWVLGDLNSLYKQLV